MKILILIVILIFSCCQSNPPIVNVDITPVIIPIPVPPNKPNIKFIDSGEDLSISYEDGKKLAGYLVDMEAYREEILAILKYYQEIQ